MKRCVLLLAFLLAALPALAQYPNRPIRLIVPFPPGGTNDLLSRLISQKLQERWGQPVVTENRAGAGGNVGADAVAKSAADGYTLLFGTNTLTINPFMVKQMPFDVQRDLAPVAMIATTPFIVGSAGAGTPHHLGTELFKTMAGVDMVHVPYKGSAQALTDVMTGQLHLMWVTINVGMPLVTSGKLRAIALGESQRSMAHRDLPTVAETLPGYEVTAWCSRPQALRRKSSAEIRERLRSLGVEITTRGARELRDVVASGLAKWREVAAAAGIRPE
jgi:tripartite-type tricarboxylate transporter receptor subunit TctC